MEVLERSASVGLGTTHSGGRNKKTLDRGERHSKHILSSFFRSLTTCASGHHTQPDKSSNSANGKQAGEAILMTEVELLPLAVNDLQEIQSPIDLKVLTEPPDEQLITAEFKPPIPPRKPLEKGRYDLFSSISELLQQNMSSCFLINTQTDKSSELTNGTQAEDAILTEVELLPLAVNNLQEIQTPINLRVLSEPPDEQLITAEFKPPIPPRKPLEKGRCNLFSSISELLQQNVSWYWGALTLEEAERLLEGRGEGCFLVRDSTSLTCVFSIAVKILPAKRPVHIRIEYVNGEFRLQCSQYSAAESVVALINKTVQLMRRGNFCFIKQRRPGVLPHTITLLSSVGRNEAVPSLKYLSRLKVRQSVGSAHLDVLPLPKTLSDYVKKCPFYDSQLVNDVISNNSTSSVASCSTTSASNNVTNPNTSSVTSSNR